jgi:hypothetical protein
MKCDMWKERELQWRCMKKIQNVENMNTCTYKSTQTCHFIYENNYGINMIVLYTTFLQVGSVHTRTQRDVHISFSLSKFIYNLFLIKKKEYRVMQSEKVICNLIYVRCLLNICHTCTFILFLKLINLKYNYIACKKYISLPSAPILLF